MNTDKTTIQHILHEDYKSIKLDTVIKIVQALNMSLLEFLDDKLFDYNNLDLQKPTKGRFSCFLVY